MHLIIVEILWKGKVPENFQVIHPGRFSGDLPKTLWKFTQNYVETVCFHKISALGN